MIVSIIIPVFNAADFLPQAIDSAILAGKATGEDWEVLLVDNNSTDGSAEILQRYASRYPSHLRVLHAVKQGAPAARNLALAVARGHWVQFLDADDYLLEYKIVNQLALAGSDTEWIIAAYKNVWASGRTEVVIPHDDPFRGLVYQTLVGHTNSNLYKRAALARAGNWNEDTTHYDDPNLFFRMLRSGAPYIIDKRVGSIYRHHEGERVTNTEHGKQARQALELVAEVITYLRNEHAAYFKRYRPFFLGALLRRIRFMATYDIDFAASTYREYFGAGTLPSGALPLVPRYTRLYPYLGFRNLERLRLALAGVLPPAVKRWAKQ